MNVEIARSRSGRRHATRRRRRRPTPRRARAASGGLDLDLDRRWHFGPRRSQAPRRAARRAALVNCASRRSTPPARTSASASLPASLAPIPRVSAPRFAPPRPSSGGQVPRPSQLLVVTHTAPSALARRARGRDPGGSPCRYTSCSRTRPSSRAIRCRWRAPRIPTRKLPFHAGTASPRCRCSRRSAARRCSTRAPGRMPCAASHE